MDKIDTKKKAFIECLKVNIGNISKACEQIGISRQTYYNWLNDNEFKETINNIDEFVLDRIEQALLTQIENGNITGIIFYLKTKGKKRGYVEKLETDNSKEYNKAHSINVQVNSSRSYFANSESEVGTNFDHLTVDELKELLYNQKPIQIFKIPDNERD